MANGHSVYGVDKIGKLTKLSSTTLSLASSTLTVGGLQYDTSGLSLDTSVSGAGGIDTGSVAANTLYYVYAVISSGSLALVASTSKSTPMGFSKSRKVGILGIDGSSNIQRVAKFGEDLKIEKILSIQARDELTGFLDLDDSNFRFDNIPIGLECEVYGTMFVSDSTFAPSAWAIVIDAENGGSTLDTIRTQDELANDNTGNVALGFHTRPFITSASDIRFNVTLNTFARVISTDTFAVLIIKPDWD